MEDWTQNPVDLYPNIYSHQHLIEQVGPKSQVKCIWDKCVPTRWADNEEQLWTPTGGICSICSSVSALRQNLSLGTLYTLIFCFLSCTQIFEPTVERPFIHQT